MVAASVMRVVPRVRRVVMHVQRAMHDRHATMHAPLEARVLLATMCALQYVPHAMLHVRHAMLHVQNAINPRATNPHATNPHARNPQFATGVHANRSSRPRLKSQCAYSARLHDPACCHVAKPIARLPKVVSR